MMTLSFSTGRTYLDAISKCRIPSTGFTITLLFITQQPFFIKDIGPFIKYHLFLFYLCSLANGLETVFSLTFARSFCQRTCFASSFFRDANIDNCDWSNADELHQGVIVQINRDCKCIFWSDPRRNRFRSLTMNIHTKHRIT